MAENNWLLNDAAPIPVGQEFDAAASASTETPWTPAEIAFNAAQGGAASHQIDPVGIASVEALGQVGLNGTIAAVGIPSAEAIGAVGLNSTVAPAGVASAAQVGAPAVQAQIGAAGIETAESFGTVSVAGTLAAVGIPSSEALGVPGLQGSIAPAGIASAEAFGPPRVAVLRVVGIASAEAFGVPVLSDTSTSQQQGVVGGFDVVRRKGPHAIRPVGIASEEEVGRPTVTAVVSRIRSRGARSAEMMMIEHERLAA